MNQVSSHTGTQHASAVERPAQRSLPALSILQPWPHMIFHHHKLIENRMWTTNVRGTILIHTGKSTRLIAPAYSQMITEELRGRGYAQCPQVGSFDIQRQLVYGALVGVASLVCCTRHRALAVQKAHEFNPDCPISQDVYADPEAQGYLVFAQVAKFAAPIPYRGERGIFQIPTSVVQHELDALHWKVMA